METLFNNRISFGKNIQLPQYFEFTQILKTQPKGDTMLKRQLGTLLLVTCLILTTVPAALSSSVNKTTATGHVTQKNAEAKSAIFTNNEASTNDMTLANEPLKGVWNNCDFSKPSGDWSESAQEFGGENGVVDLVVTQAHANKLAYLPFPFENKGYIYSDGQTDKVEPYLDRFDEEGLKVILSIQPNGADVADLIDIVLSRYSHHKSVIGVNIDMEWKLTGNSNHASNKERDLWLTKIQGYNPEYKLFLTNFEDHTYFPDDTKDLVILYDGEGNQNEILKEYKDLASHYTSVGIYTGYSSNTPRTASHENIMDAAPNTKYILHAIDD